MGTAQRLFRRAEPVPSATATSALDHGHVALPRRAARWRVRRPPTAPHARERRRPICGAGDSADRATKTEIRQSPRIYCQKDQDRSSPILMKMKSNQENMRAVRNRPGRRCVYGRHQQARRRAGLTSWPAVPDESAETPWKFRTVRIASQVAHEPASALRRTKRSRHATFH